MIVAIVAACICVLGVIGFLLFSKPQIEPERILAAYNEGIAYASLTIQYPMDGSVFPPDIAPPTFRWDDAQSGADAWLITIRFADNQEPIHCLSAATEWRPEIGQWEEIKQRSQEKTAQARILGLRRAKPSVVLSRGQISILTSKDEVGAPLFYREVNLPFVEAVKDPSKIRWRFGPVSSVQPPPVVLQGIPVCGNCHSFSWDAKTLGMDVDYANSKGSYVITTVRQQMALATSDIITWDDFKKEDGVQTFGLLSQVSPDGRVVISTVKDQSVFVPKPDLAFSQLFFPIKGILAYYRKDTEQFTALPGADDPEYVQSNPVWSPDGKYIVFARTTAYTLRKTNEVQKLLLSPDECEEFLKEGKPFKFDLYRIPFNDGKGGEPEPLEGASRNGHSNFFPKFSPDGKWIVFCQASNYMLLQPDSQLYIIPAAGGQARRLDCNTARLNSWHSWSPNSRWLVFSSKASSPYTQLCLTHINEQGYSSPPIVLENFVSPGRAANIPEFVNAPPDAIRKINEEFLNDYSYVRAGNEFFKGNDPDRAIRAYEKALEINPDNASAHERLGFLYYNVNEQYQLGITHLNKALQLDPNDGRAHYDLGMAYLHQRKPDLAARHLSEALRLMPHGLNKQYNQFDMERNLGEALLILGNTQQALNHLLKAVSIDQDHPKANYMAALACAAQGNILEAAAFYTKAVSVKPEVDTSPELHYLMGVGYAKDGQYDNAILSLQQALSLARATGKNDLVRTIAEAIQIAKSRQATPSR